ARRREVGRGRVGRFVSERSDRRWLARGVEFPRMLSRAFVRFAVARRSNPPSAVVVPARRLPRLRVRRRRAEGPPPVYFNDSPPSGDGAHGENQVFGRIFASPRLSKRCAPLARISFTAISESPRFTSTPRIAS